MSEDKYARELGSISTSLANLEKGQGALFSLLGEHSKTLTDIRVNGCSRGEQHTADIKELQDRPSRSLNAVGTFVGIVAAIAGLLIGLLFHSGCSHLPPTDDVISVVTNVIGNLPTPTPIPLPTITPTPSPTPTPAPTPIPTPTPVLTQDEAMWRAIDWRWPRYGCEDATATEVLKGVQFKSGWMRFNVENEKLPTFQGKGDCVGGCFFFKWDGDHYWGGFWEHEPPKHSWRSTGFLTDPKGFAVKSGDKCAFALMSYEGGVRTTLYETVWP
jgi:hypothetical protein